MVVDAHSGSPIGLLRETFPYDSFFMPLFIFVSGYFFNPDKIASLTRYCSYKCVRLLWPYVKHNALVGMVFTLLMGLIGFSWYGSDSPTKFVTDMLSYGLVFDVTSPSWFIISLFSVVIVYALLKTVIKNNVFVGVGVVTIGAFSVFLERQFDLASTQNYVLLLKTLFFLQFYHFGVLYRYWIEPLKISSCSLCGFGLILGIILHFFYTNNDLRFTSLAFFQSFKTDNYLLPTISSLAGISFYLGLSKCLKDSLGENHLINFISENTLTILTCHLAFINLVNFFLYILNIQFGFFQDFDVKRFSQGAWYLYTPNLAFNWVYFIFGVFGPLALLKTKAGKLLR